MKITTRKNNDSTPELSKRAAAVANQVAAAHNLSPQNQSLFKQMLDEFLEGFAPSMEAAAHAEASGRLKEILALPEAADRRETAERLALDTDTSVEQIKQILESVPVARQETPDLLAQAMAGKTPGINSDPGGPDEDAAETSGGEAGLDADSVFERRRQQMKSHQQEPQA